MVQGVDGERRPTGIPSVTLPAAPDFSRLKLPAGLALGRETLGTSLLEECLELSQQPEDDPELEQRRVCIFAINKRIFKSFLL